MTLIRLLSLRDIVYLKCVVLFVVRLSCQQQQHSIDAGNSNKHKKHNYTNSKTADDAPITVRSIEASKKVLKPASICQPQRTAAPTTTTKCSTVG